LLVLFCFDLFVADLMWSGFGGGGRERENIFKK